MKKSLMNLLGMLGVVLMLASCTSVAVPIVNDAGSSKSSAKNITIFSIGDRVGTISGTEITVNLPYGTEVTNLTPTIIISQGASVSPASGAVQNFTNPVIYTVTAEDSTTKEYTVTVTVAPSDAKDITAFSINGTAGVINEAALTVAVTLPYGTAVADLTNLTPIIIVSEGASVSPASEEAQDFTSLVTYTVTAADGSTKYYMVMVMVAVPIQVETPTLDPATGNYSTDINVTISSATDGATIYYTTDGTTPTTSSTVYSSPIAVAGNGTSKEIKAIAVKDEMADSNVASVAYVINYAKISTLSISPPSGIVASGTEVTISCLTSGVTIRYTTGNGSQADPTNSSPAYDPDHKPTLTAATVIKAKAFKTYFIDSDLATASYELTGHKETFLVGTLVPLYDPEYFALVHIDGGYTFPTGIDDSGTATVPAAYKIADTETTYKLWSAVYKFATTDAGDGLRADGGALYTFAHAGAPGSFYSGSSFQPNSTAHYQQNQPVCYVDWRDAIVWTNALTEYYNYLHGTSYGCVYNVAGVPLRDATNAIVDTVVPDTGAKGFRMPNNNERFLAARYIGKARPTIEPLRTDARTTVIDGLTYYWTPGDYASGATDDWHNVLVTSSVAVYDTSTSYGIEPWHSSEVKSRLPNALGLYDMNGNLHEWDQDVYILGNSYSQNPDQMTVEVGELWGTTGIDARLGFRIAKSE